MRKGKIVLGLLVLCTLAVFAAVGCRTGTPGNSTQNAAHTRIVTDGLGRQVVLPAKITRAVSLAPSITESVFAVGAGDRLVGVTTFCNYPEEAKAIEKVGDTLTPNIEKIIALRPDVVLVSTASQLEGFMTTLEQSHIAVYVLDPKDIEGVFADLRTLGSLFGTEASAEKVVTDLLLRVHKVEDAVAGKPPVRVFVQFSKEQLFTIGSDSFMTAVVRRAGGISVTSEVPGAYPKLSKESAIALAPDAIIISDSEDNPGPSSVLDRSPAVQNDKVLRVNADLLSRPGPRTVEALEKMAAFLHPAS